MVKHLGYEAHGAASGEAALTLLEALTPDLIIVDGMMPGMDGLEFIARVRSRGSRTESIPIIFNTACVDDDFAKAAIQRGASEVWVKSKVNLAQMRERLAAQLSQRPRK